MNLTCIDIGNTEIDIATYINEKDFVIGNVNTHDNTIFEFIELNSNPSLIKQFENVAISSVVPKIEKKIIEKFEEINISCFSISHLNSNIHLEVDSPNEVGNDRICNMKAAIKNNLYPSIIIDFGSATTYDVIDEKGHFIGGAIAPGIDVSAKYLFKKAEQLNEVNFIIPESVIGKNTKTNLQSGIMYGGIDAINGMITRIKEEMNHQIKNLILTGGFSAILSENINHKHTVDTSLTIKGIKLIWDENNK